VSLTAADVAEIMRLVEQSGFDELTLEIDGMKLTLRRGAGGQLVNGADADESASAGAGARSAAPADSSRASAPSAAASAGVAARQPDSDPNVKDVPAPLLGTFYRAPKPGAPPFVEVGATVEEDTVVAIIEVMKLMNTVRAGVRGTVSEILARDGTLVEYGETLLRVRKTG
jgi:acetyl-CoA carboxylase biotin carboxyl carrier protein